MSKVMVTSLFVLISMSVSLLSAEPLDIIDVSGDEIIVEGDDNFHEQGTWFMVIDYNGKEIAIVELKEILRPGENCEFICIVVSGDDDIKPGYRLRSYGQISLASFFVEFSRLPLAHKANSSYESLTGETSEITDKGFMASFGVSLPAFRSSVGVYLATTYMESGTVDFWDIIGVGVYFRPAIIRDRVYVGVWGGGGLGAGIGQLNWARPDGVYDDNLVRNSGEAKLSAGGLAYTYRFMGTMTVNITNMFGVQIRAGYLGLSYSGFVDKETPEDGTAEGWKIDDDWLETDIGVGGVTIGASLVINITRKQ